MVAKNFISKTLSVSSAPAWPKASLSPASQKHLLMSVVLELLGDNTCKQKVELQAQSANSEKFLWIYISDSRYVHDPTTNQAKRVKLHLVYNHNKNRR